MCLVQCGLLTPPHLILTNLVSQPVLIQFSIGVCRVLLLISRQLSYLSVADRLSRILNGSLASPDWPNNKAKPGIYVLQALPERADAATLQHDVFFAVPGLSVDS